MDEPLLQIAGLIRRFGGVTAVDDVSCAIRAGEVVGLIGPNGAGKTTLVNLISGALRSSAGRIVFRGTEITRWAPHRVARAGIARTFQIVQPFARMTVLENVMAGALFAGGAPSRRSAAERARVQLDFTGLAAFADKPASELSLANRKRLELAKSLAMEPRLLLLDEVNAGLNTGEIGEALALIRKIAERGVTIIVIEHLMHIVASLAQRIIVLHHGAVLCDGAPERVFEDQQVIEAYLGSKFAARYGARRAAAQS